MEKLLPFIISALALCGCSASSDSIYIEVSNPSNFDRCGEVVEVAWQDIKLNVATPEGVVVYNSEEQVIASQLIYDKMGTPTSILFQADVESGASALYRIGQGTHAEYEPKVYGRYVPERFDDYAWENNLTAYRIYGPSLSDPKTQGVDVWVKSTPKLIIDEWFARNDYHHNYGEGMDCYKVGNTLGGGALAIVDEGKLLLSGNYTTQERVSNGPLRTSAEFSYADIEVDGKSISMLRTITLDADSRFTRQEYLFDGFDGEIEVAAGVIMHDVKARNNAESYIAITEATSDTNNPARDGDISLAVILEGGVPATDIDSHAILTRRIKAGEKVVMLNGSGWSLGGIENHQEWLNEVEHAAECLQNPLVVKVR